MTLYNPLIPTGFVDLDEDYQNIQNNFAQLDTTFGVDHVKYSVASNNGYHTVVHLLTQASNPTSTLVAGQLFTKVPVVPSGGDSQLFYETANGGVEQISGSAASVNGYGWFSGILMQWGQYTASGGANLTATGTITFPVSFPNNGFNVQITFIGTSSSGQSIQFNGFTTDMSSKVNGFNWKFTGGSTNSYSGFFWTAIGN
jgi:hypothetical protein